MRQYDSILGSAIDGLVSARRCQGPETEDPWCVARASLWLRLDKLSKPLNRMPTHSVNISSEGRKVTSCPGHIRSRTLFVNTWLILHLSRACARPRVAFAWDHGILYSEKEFEKHVRVKPSISISPPWLPTARVEGFDSPSSQLRETSQPLGRLSADARSSGGG